MHDSQPMYQNGEKNLDYKAQFSIICWYICILCQKQAHLCLGNFDMELMCEIWIALKEVILNLPWKRCRSHHKDDAMYRTCPWFISCRKTSEVGTKEMTKNVFIGFILLKSSLSSPPTFLWWECDMPLVWDPPHDHLMRACRSVVDSHGATKLMFMELGVQV
jgi:hypothetical protein